MSGNPLNNMIAGAIQIGTEIREVQEIERAKGGIETGLGVAESLLSTAVGQDPQAVAAIKSMGAFLHSTVEHVADVAETSITGSTGVTPKAVVGAAKAMNALGL